jgi:hypothetical protein
MNKKMSESEAILGGVSTLWIYDLTIFHNIFYSKALRAYRNDHIHRVETPPVS